ncbi:MAG: flippase [Bacteroidota bacterium]
MAKSLIKNISWLGFGSAIVRPIWFVFITYVVYDTIGTSQYGLITAALSLMAILIGIASIGTSQLTIREVARDNSQADQYLTNLLPVRLLLGILCLTLGLAISQWLTDQKALSAAVRQEYMLAYAFAGCYALALNLTEFCRSFYRAHETLRDEAISIIIEKVLTVSLGTFVLLRWPSAAGALAGIATGMGITLLLNLAWVSYKFAQFKLRWLDRTFIQNGIKRALPLGLVSIFVLIYFRTDSVMLQSIQGDEATGQYGIAFRVLEALLLFPGIIVAVLLPRLSTLFAGEVGAEFNRLLNKSIWILVGFGLTAALTLSVLAPFIVGILEKGPAAIPATKALRILVWTFPFASVNYLYSTALTAADDQNVLAWILGIAVLFNISLNAVLIPTHSLYGASFATLLTQLFVMLAMIIRYRRRHASND